MITLLSIFFLFYLILVIKRRHYENDQILQKHGKESSQKTNEQSQ